MRKLTLTAILLFLLLSGGLMLAQAQQCPEGQYCTYLGSVTQGELPTVTPTWTMQPIPTVHPESWCAAHAPAPLEGLQLWKGIIDNRYPYQMHLCFRLIVNGRIVGGRPEGHIVIHRKTEDVIQSLDLNSVGSCSPSCSTTVSRISTDSSSIKAEIAISYLGRDYIAQTEFTTIPPPTPWPTETPLPGTLTPTNTPEATGELLVLSSTGAYSATSYWIYGELRNDLSIPAFKPAVRAWFYNDRNQLLGAGENYLPFPLLPIGALGSFAIIIPNSPEGIHHYRFEPWRTGSTPTVTYRYVAVLSTQVHTTPSMYVSGEIKNLEPSALHDVKLMLTAYDAAGKVVYAASGIPTKTTLQPEETVPYTISISDVVTFDHVVVQAQGYIP